MLRGDSVNPCCTLKTCPCSLRDNQHLSLSSEPLQPAQCGLDLRHVTVVELVGIFPALIGRIGVKLLPPSLALQLR